MIKTIIFDLGGVYFTDGTKQAIQVISSQYGIPVEKVHAVLKGGLGAKYRTGSITVEEFWNQAKASWNIKAINNDLSAIWLSEYVPIEGTVDIVKQLQALKYELLFLSDNVQERVDYLESKYHFLQYFADGVFSHVVKVRKPDPLIYKLVREKSLNQPEECIYIDDKAELLEPARKMGMKTIHFQNPAQLLEDLKAHGIMTLI